MDITTPTAAVVSPAAAAPVAADPASPAAAPAAAASVPVATPAAAAPAANGWLARLSGVSGVVAALETDLANERTAHQSTRDQLATAMASLSTYQQLERDVEAQINGLQARATTAETAAASVPTQVAAGVADVVAGLGIECAALPAAQTDVPGPGNAGEFAHLSGRERATAAFAAQLQGLLN